MKMSKIASEIAIAMELTKDKNYFKLISTFSLQISAVTKHEKIILFIDLNAEFHVLKLLFEDFLPKIIREAVNCKSLILRVKFLYCLKYDGTHGILFARFVCYAHFSQGR